MCNNVFMFALFTIIQYYYGNSCVWDNYRTRVVYADRIDRLSAESSRVQSHDCLEVELANRVGLNVMQIEREGRLDRHQGLQKLTRA